MNPGPPPPTGELPSGSQTFGAVFKIVVIVLGACLALLVGVCLLAMIALQALGKKPVHHPPAASLSLVMPSTVVATRPAPRRRT